MDIRLYFWSASKFSVVLVLVILRMVMSLRLIYSPILLRRIAQVLLNHLPSQDLESGDTTKSGKKLFPGSSWMKIYWVHFANYAKRVEDLFRGLVGLGLPNHSFNWKKVTQKMKSHS